LGGTQGREEVASVYRKAMPRQQRPFTCMIHDKVTDERFSARVLVSKKFPIESSTIDAGKVELADIFIWPLVEQKKAWGPTILSDNAGGILTSIEYRDTHSHFILYDLSGSGKYIRRDDEGRDLEKRICSIWDLGNPFGSRVTRLLTALM
jgi:hypothetical protein